MAEVGVMIPIDMEPMRRAIERVTMHFERKKIPLPTDNPEPCARTVEHKGVTVFLPTPAFAAWVDSLSVYE